MATCQSFSPLDTSFAGAGLKPEHVEGTLAGPRCVDFFEIHAENYMGAGGPPHHLLRRICADYPLSVHGVGLSIGGASALDRDHLKRLKRLIDIYQPALFSEHLAWSTHDGIFLNDLLPLPYNEVSLAHVCDHVSQVQDSLRIRMLLENPSTYVVFGNSTMTEIEFLRAVTQRTGCGLLLDVTNVHVSAINHGFDAAAYIDSFPMQHVGEFHLAGFAEDSDSCGARLLIDDHGCPVRDVVWDLYRRAFARCHAPTLIEWDNNVPPFAVLAADAERARKLLPRALYSGPRDSMLALALESPPMRLQRAFAEAILYGDAPVPATVREASGSAHASRFSVYRNNVIAGLINAVSARYPVVRKLLWDDAFNRVAHQYVVSEPPRSPVLLQYGESFPKFLRGIGQGAAANYLADVAEIESARTRAYHAADAAPLSLAAFNAVPTDEWPELHIALHPSIALLKSDFPAVSIWRANLYANDNTLDVWKPECALIARPHLEVEVRIISAGVYEFIAALAQGQTVGAAFMTASAKVPDFDLAECFNVLIAADLVVSLERRLSIGD